MFRPLVAASAAALIVLGLTALPAAASPEAAGPRPVKPAPAVPQVAAAAQTLTWTADNDIDSYQSQPTTAVAGETTIVFENSEATGNTTFMTHTLTFDTSTAGYNHDVPENITANPLDANGGRYEKTVTFTPGKYRFYCTVPGHSTMAGELTVTAGGGEDTTPPTVTAEITGTQDADGNYVGSATATLTATDAGSGVDSVEYQLDGGAWTAYSAPVAVNTAGEHMLHYRATDVAGNASPEGMESFTVVEDGGGEDTTPPTVTAEVTGTQDADGKFVGSATVTVTAADEGGSGVELVEYEIDDTGFQPYTEPVVVTDPGDHSVQYRATDVAGNASTTGSTPFAVVEDGGGEDTTPPTVTAEVTGTQDTEGNYVDAAVVTISATDAGSGVDSVEYQLDSAEWAAYTAPVTVNAPGEHMVHFRATDVAGNASPDGMESFTVVEQDTTAPTAAATVVGEQDPDGNFLGSAVVTVTAEDEGSGVDTIEYSLDGGDWTAYTEAVQVRAAGEHTFAYRATDLAGNVSAEGAETFTVVANPDEDTTPPSVTAVVTGNQDANWNFLDTATVTVSALDVDSGVKLVEYKLDDGEWTAYTEPLAVSAGEHTVWYRATDNAGNVAAEQSGSFTVIEVSTDECPDSDTRDTVWIGVENTYVSNEDTGNGCTISDLIAQDDEYPTHTAFVRHVKQVTNGLVTAGVLTSVQRDIIVRAATRSDIGVNTAAV
ncbi:OmpL47-type beta-barrel domain-containing protein [Actinophytocola sediminis]